MAVCFPSKWSFVIVSVGYWLSRDCRREVSLDHPSSGEEGYFRRIELGFRSGNTNDYDQNSHPKGLNRETQIEAKKEKVLHNEVRHLKFMYMYRPVMLQQRV